MNYRYTVVAILCCSVSLLFACRSKSAQRHYANEAREEASDPARFIERWLHPIELMRSADAIRLSHGRLVALREGACPVLIDIDGGELVPLDCSGEVTKVAQSESAIFVQGPGLDVFDGSTGERLRRLSEERLLGATASGWFSDREDSQLSSFGQLSDEASWTIPQPSGQIFFYPRLILAVDEGEWQALSAESGQLVARGEAEGQFYGIKSNPNCRFVGLYWREYGPWHYEFFDVEAGAYLGAIEEEGLIADIACTPQSLAYATWSRLSPSALVRIDVESKVERRAEGPEDGFLNAKVFIAEELPWVSSPGDGLAEMLPDGTLSQRFEPPVPIGDLFHGTEVVVVNDVLFALRQESLSGYGAYICEPATFTIIDMQSREVLKHEVHADTTCTRLELRRIGEDKLLVYRFGAFTLYDVARD